MRECDQRRGRHDIELGVPVETLVISRLACTTRTDLELSILPSPGISIARARLLGG